MLQTAIAISPPAFNGFRQVFISFFCIPTIPAQSPALRFARRIEPDFRTVENPTNPNSKIRKILPFVLLISCCLTQGRALDLLLWLNKENEWAVF